MKPLKLDYKAGIADVVNNGHTVQINYAPGSTLSVDGIMFELKQFHFHSPSENKINGKQFPLESHLVHADKDGNLAVVAVMFQEGAAHTLLAKLWEKMPNKAGEKSALPTGLSVSQLLPKGRDYYRFNGSLTTPPCSEGVRWFVMKQPAAGVQGADPAVFQGDRVRQQPPDSVDKRARRPAIAVKVGLERKSYEEITVRSKSASHPHLIEFSYGADPAALGRLGHSPKQASQNRWLHLYCSCGRTSVTTAGVGRG